jgi:hypothetical protein
MLDLCLLARYNEGEHPRSAALYRELPTPPA